MGACMKPPRLAIVTSMVHGITLYKYIHLRRDKFSMGKTTIIAQQISQVHYVEVHTMNLLCRWTEI
jgi:kinase suppressor of Ras 2